MMKNEAYMRASNNFVHVCTCDICSARDFNTCLPTPPTNPTPSEKTSQKKIKQAIEKCGLIFAGIKSSYYTKSSEELWGKGSTPIVEPAPENFPEKKNKPDPQKDDIGNIETRNQHERDCYHAGYTDGYNAGLGDTGGSK